MSLPRLAALAAAALLLAACATPLHPNLAADAGRAGLPRAAQVADVPFFAQDDHYCGPAALAMALAWSGLDVNQDDLVPVVFTPGRQGTLQADILAGARRHGRLAVPVADMPALLAELATGHPVLVLQNLGLGWWPQWHFAVATGYDLATDRIRLHSGTTADLELRRATFERTWARAGEWALTVLPPDRLPAAAGEPAVLEAAVALERADQPAAAQQAYGAALGRWPASLPAWIGLGNTAYALGDLAGAEAAFTAAVERFPESAAAKQNLAYVRRALSAGSRPS